MLTGVCRYKIVEQTPHIDGYTIARVDWSGFENDYETEVVESEVIEGFKENLRHYFERNSMKVDWEVLDKLPIEQVVNNLVLVLDLDIDSKQRLLESPTVSHRLELFSNLTDKKVVSIRAR